MEEFKLSSCCSISPEEAEEKMGMRQSGRVPVSCPPSFQGRYTVVPGDTMFFIAQRFGVSLQALINANPHISNPSLIYPGDVLCVPGVSPSPVCRVPVSCPPGFACRYTVVPGDTMFFIAQRFGVSLQALINANPQITNPSLIYPCDVLCVPCPVPQPVCRIPVTCPPGFECRYTVVAGDTMFLIAQRFGVPLQALIAANPQITNPSLIYPCDVLCVPCPVPQKFPCCVVLKQITPIPGSDALGVALAQNLVTNQQALSVLAARVPLPSQLGEFNAHEAVIVIPGVTTLRLPLIMVQDNPTLYAGTLNLGPCVLTADTRILIRPYRTKTSKFGDALLSGTLTKCC